MEHLDFNLFKNAVNKQFTKMVQSGLVLVQADITGDQLWDIYLKAYPAEVSENFRTRHHYEGNYDKSFIRRLGNVVGIDEKGVVHSIWDCNPTGYFQLVADALSKAVKEKSYTEYFYTTEIHAGHKPNRDFHNPEILWTHFYTDIPAQFVQHKDRIGPFTGELRNTRDVFLRGLKDFSVDAAEMVLELIDQNSLYRGAEHKQAINSFLSHKRAYDRLTTDEERKAYVYTQAHKVGPSLRFRSTVIGTLVEDISNGIDLEKAVASFEFKVAPQNYKRTSAPVTKNMITDAQAKIEELGLTESLYRRFAAPTDIDVNNVLFTAVGKKSMDVFDDLTEEADRKVKAKSLSKVEEISADKFLKDVLPTATKVEVLVEGRHAPNLVSLMTSKNPTSTNMFKWNNQFSWAYTGDITDSIKERVKAAGGNVNGVFRVSLAWFNSDDLDLSLEEPSGSKIYFGTRTSSQGGRLDIDANGGTITSRTEPVENIYYTEERQVRDGDYDVIVNQFSRRENVNKGFTLQVEYKGEIFNFAHNDVFDDKHTRMMKIRIKDGKIEFKKVHDKLVASGTASKEIWGINTNTFVPATVIMNSPNFWDGQTEGNKHIFFMLDGCKTVDQTRGFFNEFLSAELTPHRRVFELLGAKVKVTPEPTDEQVSGLGFNTTTRNEVTVRVTGKTKRTLLVKF